MQKWLELEIIVDDIPYQHGDLENLPVGLRLSDSKVLKVKGGYAFASKHAYLSNLFVSKFKYNGIIFDSVERAYQFERAKTLKAPKIAQQILDCRTPMDCKRLSGQVWSNVAWDSLKQDVMKQIVYEKFAQNEILQNTLFTTGNKTLIEGTTDSYLGAAAILGLKLLKNGKWKSQNQLGIILGEVREDLKRTYNWVEMQSITSENPSENGSEIPPNPLELQQQSAPLDGSKDLPTTTDQLTNINVHANTVLQGGGDNAETHLGTAPTPPANWS